MTFCNAADRQQVSRTERFGADIGKLAEMAPRLRAKLENCCVKINRYTVSIAAEERRIPNSDGEPGDRKRFDGQGMQAAK